MLSVRTLTLAHLTIGSTPLETIVAAAHAGFGAVGIRICGRRVGDVFATPTLGNAMAIRALRDRAADLGVRLSNVSGYQFYPGIALADVAPVVHAAADLGVPVIVANSFDSDEARFTALFSQYCELAAQANIRIALEFLPYSGVRDLTAALRIVQRSEAPNAGILPDALHLDRSGGRASDLRHVPRERIVFAQVCDALPWIGERTDEALMREARTGRMPPGAGTLALDAFLDALPPDCEVEYEVNRADMADRPPGEKARVAALDAERYLAEYGRRRSALAAGSGA